MVLILSKLESYRWYYQSSFQYIYFASLLHDFY